MCGVGTSISPTELNFGMGPAFGKPQYQDLIQCLVGALEHITMQAV